MKRIATFVVLVVLCLVYTSCQKKKGAAGTPPAGSVDEMLNRPLTLENVIVSKPPSIMSVLAPIDLNFNEPVIPQHQVGSVLDKSPFEFKPEIKGSAKWISQTAIRFNPTRPLAAGVSYEAVFTGKTAFGTQRNVDNFKFSFKTAEQEIIEFTGDFEPDTSGKNMVRFKGVMTFAQPIEVNKIQKDLGCVLKKKTVALSLESTEKPDKIKITSSPLSRGDKAQMMTFTLPKSYTADQEKWSRDMELPEKEVFKVIAHMDLTDAKAAQPVYGFRFNDPIKTGMDLSGYVVIEPDVKFTVSVDNKYLKVQGSFIIGEEYSVTVRGGLKSAYGTKLGQDYIQTVAFSNLKPEVVWLSEGIYLPSDNNFKLQFKSVNVGKIRVVVNEIYPKNIGFFIQTNLLQDRKTRSSGYDDEEYYYDYQSSDFSDLNRVGKQIWDTVYSIGDERNKWIRSELDMQNVFKGKHNTAFTVTLSFTRQQLCGECTNDRSKLSAASLFYDSNDDNYYTNPCGDGYYYRHGSISKLLIASDIGLTLKKTDEGLHVYAVDVSVAKPAGGLVLELYTYQNQLLNKQKTDGDGHAFFPDMPDNGYYIRAKHSYGQAIIRLDHQAWETSSFDIAGFEDASKGVDAFMYADRGVHRPGDTVNLAAIVRMDRKNPPEEQPVQLKVYNPKGQVVSETAQPCGKNGHLYFAVPTGISDPTGSWRAELNIAGQSFSKELKIETVRPNRLKVFIETGDTLEPGSAEISGTLSSRYLFGTPAAGLSAKMRVDVWETSLNLPAWSGFTFRHPLRRFDRRDNELFEDNLDGEGMYGFSHTVEEAELAPELLQAQLQATVYERGGGFTNAGKKVLIVPFSTFVGIESPFRWGYAQTGTTYTLPVIVTNVRGKAVPGRKLKVKWYVNKSYWWWDYDSRSRPDFRQHQATYTLGEFSLTSGDKPVKQKLEVEDYGQHFIEVIDEESGHACGMFFYASSWGTGPEQARKERSFLDITSDKNVYYTGEKATLSCETPKAGLVLFTIEQGNRILRQEIKPAAEGRTSFTFDVGPEMVPNCYAVMSLIQPHGQTANDLPLRIYGIKPLAVEDYSTRLQLTLKAPDEIRPKETFSVSVTSGAPKTASFTLAIVDEGLLDLTGFETPDPWKHYFRKMRLGILTRDNFEEILNLIFPDADRRFSIGGDFEEQRQKRAGESKVQRFRPVVLYTKPMTIKPGETSEIKYTMPNYVGSVRIMLVGTSENSYASAEKAVPVRQPLMVLSTVPRVARPGDRFAIPVSVFAMDKSVTSASVSIKVTSPLKVDGDASASVTFDKPGEKEAVFNVFVKKSIGASKITVTAKSGGHKASDEIDLPVTCPNPYYIQARDTIVTSANPVTFKPTAFGLEGTNACRISFTRFPDIQVNKRYKDLIHYPYGCIEQTTSGAFPQLYIGNLIDLSSAEKKMITDNINGGIARLHQFMMGGGFSYWPVDLWNSGAVSDWGTLYAGHFLVEAKAAGYHVPNSLFNHWLGAVKKHAKTVDRGNHRYQCYRLFLLSLAGHPHQGAMNLVRENWLPELDPLSKKMLAASFYLAGQKDAAAQIDKSIKTEITAYREMGGTYGSSLRDQAFMAYLAYTINDMQTATKVLASVAKDFRPWGWYSTQETAFALMAVSTVYSKSPMTGGAINFTVETAGKKEKYQLKGYETSVSGEKMWDKEVTIYSESAGPLFVTLFEEGIPIDNRIKTEQNGLELTRNFYDEDGNSITLKDIRQGAQFWVRYRVRSTTQVLLENLALSSLFPSGWEIINTRLEETALPQWVTNFGASYGTYMDLRDDRANWFFDLRYNYESNFVVKCNASFKGTFFLPPVTVEPMYSPDYYGRIAGQEVTVE